MYRESDHTDTVCVCVFLTSQSILVWVLSSSLVRWSSLTKLGFLVSRTRQYLHTKNAHTHSWYPSSVTVAYVCACVCVHVRARVCVCACVRVCVTESVYSHAHTQFKIWSQGKSDSLHRSLLKFFRSNPVTETNKLQKNDYNNVNYLVRSSSNFSEGLGRAMISSSPVKIMSCLYMRNE